jgi:hypothetical protein
LRLLNIHQKNITVTLFGKKHMPSLESSYHDGNIYRILSMPNDFLQYLRNEYFEHLLSNYNSCKTIVFLINI